MTDKPCDEEAIFKIACQIASPEARVEYLHQICGDNEAIFGRVVSLLRVYEEESGFLESPLQHVGVTADVPLISEKPGTQIGPYKLLQVIGEGGMGVVFMAEQTQPVQRKVAIKVIKPGMDSRQVIARFEAERQALAMMDHVNIARVLDAGATESGRPYFVMELIHGVPITRYCDDNQLTPRERLELFVPVCQAIQHAHQKGIIHRDIKPSNVMITLYDGKPVPKVIDFGVAKATDQKLTERTLFTQYGTMVGTLEYMSPEQAEMSALGVDTRSDIYSLGVLLYELLTGSTPLSSKRMKEAAFAEVLRLIKEEEPPRPSIRLSESGEALASISAQRQMEPVQLSKLMRGELDWIVMKTLEKDRNRRYETANGFAADVLRYLNDEAVLACPPSAAYRFRKFARRNKVALTTVLLVTTALMVGMLVSAVQAVRATKAEALAETRLDETEEAHKEAITNLKKAREAVDQMLTRVADETLVNVPQMEQVRKALLEDAVKFYEGFLQQKNADPALRLETGRALHRVGLMYHTTMQHDEAEKALRDSVKLLDELVVDFPDEPDYRAALAEGCLTLGDQLMFGSGQHGEAEPVLRRAASLFERLAAECPEVPLHRARSARVRNSLASAERYLGRADNAEPEYRKGLAVIGILVDEYPGESLYCELQSELLNNFGEATARKDPQESERLLSQALAIRLKLLKESPNSQLYQFAASCTQASLAGLFRADGRLPAAEQAYRQAIALGQQLVADFPSILNYRSALTNHHVELGSLLEDTNRRDGAEQAYRLAWAVSTDMGMPRAGPPNYWYSRLDESQTRLVNLLTRAGRTPEVEAHYRQALVLWQKLAEQSPAVLEFRHKQAETHRLLAGVLLADDRPEEAEQATAQLLTLLEETLALTRIRLGSEHPDTLKSINTLAVTYAARGRHDEALKLHEEALRLRKAGLGPDHPDTLISIHNLANAYCAAGRFTEAEHFYQEAVSLFPNSSSAHNGLAWFLATCPDSSHQNAARAIELATRAIELANGGGDWNTLGVAQYRAGDYQAAVATLQKSMGRTSGGSAFDWFFLAMAHQQLNDRVQARMWFDKAVEWVTAPPPHTAGWNHDELRRFRDEAQVLLGLSEAEQPVHP